MPYKSKEAKMEAQRARRVKPLVEAPIIEAPNVEAPAQMKPLNEAPNLDHISSVFKTPEGRQKLLDILAAFEDSHHPEYMEDVRLGYYGHTLRAIKNMSR